MFTVPSGFAAFLGLAPCGAPDKLPFPAARRAEPERPSHVSSDQIGGDEDDVKESKSAVREAIRASKSPLERLTDEITSVDELRLRGAGIVKAMQTHCMPGSSSVSRRLTVQAKATRLPGRI